MLVDTFLGTTGFKESIISTSIFLQHQRNHFLIPNHHHACASTTRLRPAALPAYRAASARRMVDSADAPGARLRHKRLRHVRERAIEALLFLAALISVLTTLAIIYVLVSESWPFFRQVPLADFLFDTQWTPLFEGAHYGIVVLLSGTLTSSAIALLVADGW